MGDEYQPFRTGKTSYPLEVNPTVPAFARIEPHVDAILDYVLACMRTHLGEAWDAEVVKPRVGNPALVGKIVYRDDDTYNNYALYPYNVIPHLTQSQTKFPALAMWWMSSEYVEVAHSNTTERARYSLAYILPPLSAEQMGSILPFIRGFIEIVKNRLILVGHDKTWRSDALVAREAGADAIRLLSAESGWMDKDKIGPNPPELLFYAASVELELDLSNKPVYSEPGLIGFDTTISLADPLGDQVIIETAQELDPYP